MGKISHSRTELYSSCGKKYYFKYVEKLEPNNTPLALLFGLAIDKSINYLLTQFKKKKKISLKRANTIFLKEMGKWTGQNELIYFKNELPDGYDPEGKTMLENQLAAFENMKIIGQMMLETYNSDILPLFDEIIDIQIEKKINNEDGDTLSLVVDFIVKLKDGRLVLMDNKTSSKPYKDDSVKTSPQLALYSEYFENKYCGYIVLLKKLKDGKIAHQVLVDEISEEFTQSVFDGLEEKMGMIKAEIFEKNEKNCWSFGKRCPYWDACKKNDISGLIKR